MRTALAMLATMLIGCASAAPECDSWHADASLTPEQAARARSAVEKWRAHSGRISWDESGEGRACSIRVLDDAEYEDVKPEVGGDYVGAWRKRDGSVVLAPWRMTCGARQMDCFEGVVLHELGHAQGLGHTDTGVMSNGQAVWLEID